MLGALRDHACPPAGQRQLVLSTCAAAGTGLGTGLGKPQMLHMDGAGHGTHMLQTPEPLLQQAAHKECQHQAAALRPQAAGRF